MKRVSFPLADGAYADETRNYSFQECINFIPEASETEGSKTSAILRGAPGLRVFTFQAIPPMRGMHDLEGETYFVAGQTLYRRFFDNVESLGTIPGTGRVEFAHNQIAGGNQLVISTGTTCYVFSNVDDSLVQITDPGFPGGFSPVFVDGYIAFIAPGGDFWFHSELNDALSYNTLDRYQGEFSPDKLVALRTIQGRIRAFSQRTIEEYQNSGALTNTFVRGTVIDEGCAGTYTPEFLDNSLIWLGDDGIIYRDFAYNPQRISTFAIEQILSENSTEWASAIAFTYSSRGHKIYYLTVGQWTFGYDCATGKWHRRQSFGLNYWRVNCTAYSQGVWYAGSSLPGELYKIEWNAYDEDGSPLIARRTSGYLFDSQNRIICSMFELLVEVGFGTSPDNKATMRYSDDGGYTWSSFREESIGAIGNYRDRVQFLRLGSFRSRIWDIQISSPCNRDLMGAVMVVQGTEG